MSSIIPLDIEELIIDLLAEDDKKEYLTLKTCSLVCRTFLPLCRKHIFGNIRLNYIGTPTTLQLEQLLTTSPEIAHYIRKLDYHIKSHDFTRSASIHECLKQISRLEFLSVGYFSWGELDWSNNPLRPALLRLLHLPTLNHFLIGGIENFIASDLIPCVNLKKLHIDDHMTGAAINTYSGTLPNRSIRLNEFKVGFKSDIMDICTARRPDGQPVVDFSSLSKIKILFDGNYIENPEELFKRCDQLTHASISFHDPRSFCPSLSKLLRPSMETLTHLDITTSPYGLDVDPLAGIPSELEDMRYKNIIEKITINVLVKRPTGCRHGDDWGRLDEVLTRPGWSALREVLLNIEIDAWITKESSFGAALQSLPETQFPDLSRSKSVSFKLEVIRT